jgi:mRNA interferase YafQ
VSKYQVKQTSRFRKDLKRLIKQGKDMGKLAEVVDILVSGEALGEKYRDHPLASDWSGFRDCHIEPDWLLIYKVEEDILPLTLTRSGSHAELRL